MAFWFTESSLYNRIDMKDFNMFLFGHPSLLPTLFFQSPPTHLLILHPCNSVLYFIASSLPLLYWILLTSVLVDKHFCRTFSLSGLYDEKIDEDLNTVNNLIIQVPHLILSYLILFDQFFCLYDHVLSHLSSSLECIALTSNWLVSFLYVLALLSS